jgi:predicted metal-dependent HD superfamily phosphohydrolase
MISKGAELTKVHFEAAQEKADSLLKGLDPRLTYHNKRHTLKFVVPAALGLAEREGLSQSDTYAAGIAALFHDAGFLQRYRENEPIGAKYAIDFMIESGLQYPSLYFPLIKDAILNTNMENPPKTQLDKILRDADMAVLGNPKFSTWNLRLQIEYQRNPESAMHILSVSDKGWIESQLKLLQSHEWFTSAAGELYQRRKVENLRKLKMFYGVFDEEEIKAMLKGKDKTTLLELTDRVYGGICLKRHKIKPQELIETWQAIALLCRCIEGIKIHKERIFGEAKERGVDVYRDRLANEEMTGVYEEEHTSAFSTFRRNPLASHKLVSHLDKERLDFYFKIVLERKEARRKLSNRL